MLRQIRWKLAFSYTLVTILTLLVVEAGILAAAFVFLGSDLLPRRLAETMVEDLAPEAAPYLKTTPPRVVELQQWLQTFTRPSYSLASGEQGLYIQTAPLGGNGRLLVLDLHYQILAAVPAVPGEESLYLASIPGLSPLLQKAMAGEEDPTRLYSRQPEGMLLVAAPVREENGEILGALVLVSNFPVNFRIFAWTLLKAAAQSFLLLIGPVATVGTLAGLLVSRPISRRLQHLVQIASLWGRGKLSVRIGDNNEDELGQLAQSLDHMAARLQELLAAEKQWAIVEERNRVARDLHDTLKQRLFAIRMEVAAIQALAERGDSETVQQHVAQVESLVQQAQEEVMQAIHNLRLAGPERDIEHEIREHLSEWSQRSGIPFFFRSAGGLLVSSPIGETLNKILQEALTNVARHSGATRVEVTLEQENGQVRLTIADDGRGFVPEEVRGKGLGLLSMQERAQQWGGSLTIESAPSQGTRLIIQIPFEEGER